jgi:ribosomal-protein-alanine N-acetyltransferase
MSTRLTTERLVLRPPRTDDVGEVRRLLRNNRAHLAPWNPAPEPGVDPTAMTAVSNAILAHRREWKTGRAFAFFLSLREKPRFVGKISLTGIHRGALHGAYLGYFMDVDHQNAGLCTEGIGAVLDFAFGPAGLHRIQAAIMPSNAKSLRVITKLGFRREGYAERYLRIAGAWEDHVLFARTREEHVGFD